MTNVIKLFICLKNFNMAKSSKTTTVKVNRSAKTGEFVSKEYAKKHKNTTVTETVKKKKS